MFIIITLYHSHLWFTLSKIGIVKPLLWKTERMKQGGICRGMSRWLNTLSTQEIVTILIARLRMALWDKEFKGSGKHLK